ncbi:MAG: type II secretion system protein [Opitutae bacterium]|nr:type II secretion system protein [Opitutae bacterium]
MLEAPSGATGRRAAFTLLELLAVTALIAILAGIVLGVGRRASDAGRIARARAELAALSVALEGYRRAQGDYPRTDDESRLLQSLIGKRDPANTAISGRAQLEPARFVIARLAAPGIPVDPFAVVDSALVDPWGRPYVYVYKVPAGGWANSGFVLCSAGPDGKDSGALLPGGFADSAPPENADNIYANP